MVGDFGVKLYQAPHAQKVLTEHAGQVMQTCMVSTDHSITQGTTHSYA